MILTSHFVPWHQLDLNAIYPTYTTSRLRHVRDGKALETNQSQKDYLLIAVPQMIVNRRVTLPQKKIWSRISATSVIYRRYHPTLITKREFVGSACFAPRAFIGGSLLRIALLLLSFPSGSGSYDVQSFFTFPL